MPNDPSSLLPVNGFLQKLNKEYTLMGTTHIRAWQLYLLIGFIAGTVTGVVLVANQKGKFTKTKATGGPTEQIVEPGSWQLIGPGGGGRITAITEDSSNANNLYMTINVGGARRSRDGGTTWQIINRGFDYATRGDDAQRMADIAVHPTKSNVLLGAGLGGDLYYSLNGGDTWMLSKRLTEGYDFSRFTFDPLSPDVVYVAVGSIQKLILGVDAQRSGAFWPKIEKGPTIFRGQWTGSTWIWSDAGSIPSVPDSANPPRNESGSYYNIYSIGVNPQNAKEFFFVTERGLYKGELRGGNTIVAFTKIKQGLPSDRAFHGGKIVFDPVNKGTAYLTVMNLGLRDEERGVGGVFKSTDGGNTWTKLSAGLDTAYSNYFDIQIDPKTPGTIYVAQFYNDITETAGNLYRSVNGGASFSKIIDWARADPGWGADYDRPGFVEKPGPDFVSVSRFDNTIRFTNGGGHLFQNEAGAEPYTWKPVLTKKVGSDAWTTTGSEAIAVAFSIGVDPKNSDILYLPYGDHMYLKSMDGGASVKILSQFPDMKAAGNNGDSGTIVVDVIESNKIYAATRGPHQQLKDGGVMYSRDGGKTWQTIGGHKGGGDATKRGLPRAAMTDLLVEYRGTAPASKRNLSVASFGYAEKNAPGGVYYLEDTESQNNWIRILSKDRVHSIAERGNFAEIFAGVNGEGVYKINREISATGSSVQGPIDVGGSKIFYDMETDSGGFIYVATEKGLFTIDNKTDAVKQVDIPQIKRLPKFKSAVEVFPKDPRIIYFATDSSEVLRSGDFGATWQEVSRDIPTLGFQMLKIDPNQDIIYVESAGAGIWKKKFAAPPAPILSVTNLQMTPKPETRSFDISWTLSEDITRIPGIKGHFIEVGTDCKPWNGTGEPQCVWQYWYVIPTLGIRNFNLSRLPSQRGDQDYTDGPELQYGKIYCVDVYLDGPGEDTGRDVYACGKLEKPRISPPR